VGVKAMPRTCCIGLGQDLDDDLAFYASVEHRVDRRQMLVEPDTPWYRISQPWRVRMGGVPPPILSRSQGAIGPARR